MREGVHCLGAVRLSSGIESKSFVSDRTLIFSKFVKLNLFVEVGKRYCQKTLLHLQHIRIIFIGFADFIALLKEVYLLSLDYFLASCIGFTCQHEHLTGFGYLQ